MSDQWAIHAEALRKVYRLYRKPAYKFLDLFGLCPTGERFYIEYPALDGLDLTIRRGEKIAIIGRNGAGKSTLLKVVAGTLAPTSGGLDVRGTVKALLEIGTGFHQEFTGRENVLASLAHQGIMGVRALHKLDEIVDFAELEDYIDQPIKTYSTGMGMRLMFAAATCLEPDILVADEVLGVGDAYFRHKSFVRMKELTERHGTTFLLVTHDLYSALLVCDRFIWIEKGRIQADGPGKIVVSAYEQSIRDQEEVRQRSKKTKAVQREDSADVDSSGFTLLLSPGDQHTLDSSFLLRALHVTIDNGSRCSLSLDKGGLGNSIRYLPNESVSQAVVNGHRCLRWAEYGDLFHKLEFWVPFEGERQEMSTISLEYHYAGIVPVALSLSFDGKDLEPIALLGSSGADWRREDIALQVPTANSPVRSLLEEVNRRNRYGTGEIIFEALRFSHGSGGAGAGFKYGDPMVIELDYSVRNPDIPRTNVIAIAFHKDGAIPATRFIHPAFSFDGHRGTVRLFVPKLRFGAGTYMVTASIFRPAMRERMRYEFFATSPNVIDTLVRFWEFEVWHDEPLEQGVVYLEDVVWGSVHSPENQVAAAQAIV